jgi:hypothetical protein
MFAIFVYLPVSAIFQNKGVTNWLPPFENAARALIESRMRGGAFDERNSGVGREILRTCPIGSRCHIETPIVGDSGIPFIVNIERIK